MIGCSPSPCESISSELPTLSTVDPIQLSTDDILIDETTVQPETIPHNNLLRQQSELFQTKDNNNNTNEHTRQFKEYLQSFERRNSDSNCLLNHSASCEKMNLAAEIKKLSERLMMLSSINSELNDYNETVIASDKNEPILPSQSSKDEKPLVKEKPEFLKKPKLGDIRENPKSSNFSENLTKTTKSSKSTFSKSSTITSSSNKSSTSFESSSSIQKQTNGGLSERLKVLEDTPTLAKKLDNSRKVSENITITRNSRFEPATISPPNSVPWPITNRRTKFRVTQMSRDVPVGSPDKHQTVFLEEAVTTTKDCLLHLLEKYNENETRTAYCNTGRHQSVSMGFGLSDNLEYRSMNSLNYFFQRHATGGKTVKQIQAQIESKRIP